MTAQVADTWERGDPYERYVGRWSRRVAPRFLAWLGAPPDARWLDVGCGTGALCGAIAQQCAPRLLAGVEPSEGFLKTARQRLGSHAELRPGNAASLPFPDGTFDVVVSGLVLNFVPDHRKAIAEMRRVTRARGVVSACVWDYNEGMQMLRVFWDEAVALDPGVAPKDERHMKLSRAGQLGELWREAGLARVEEAPLAIRQAYASFDDYWGPFLMGAGPGGAHVVSLGEERRRQLEGRLRKRLLGDRADGPFTLEARAWCVRGEVP